MIFCILEKFWRNKCPCLRICQNPRFRKLYLYAFPKTKWALFFFCPLTKSCNFFYLTYSELTSFIAMTEQFSRFIRKNDSVASLYLVLLNCGNWFLFTHYMFWNRIDFYDDSGMPCYPFLLIGECNIYLQYYILNFDVDFSLWLAKDVALKIIKISVTWI